MIHAGHIGISGAGLSMIMAPGVYRVSLFNLRFYASGTRFYTNQITPAGRVYVKHLTA